MKKTPLAIAITFVLTSAAWYAVTSVHNDLNRVLLRSSVKAPGRMALDVIGHDLETGDYKTAKAHLTVLREAWKRFDEERGPTIEQGIGNIMVEFRDLPIPQETEQETEPSAAGGPGTAGASPGH